MTGRLPAPCPECGAIARTIGRVIWIEHAPGCTRAEDDDR